MNLHSQSELYALVGQLLEDKDQSAKLTEGLRRDLRAAHDNYAGLMYDYNDLVEKSSPSYPLHNARFFSETRNEPMRRRQTISWSDPCAEIRPTVLHTLDIPATRVAMINDPRVSPLTNVDVREATARKMSNHVLEFLREHLDREFG